MCMLGRVVKEVTLLGQVAYRVVEQSRRRGSLTALYSHGPSRRRQSYRLGRKEKARSLTGTEALILVNTRDGFWAFKTFQRAQHQATGESGQVVVRVRLSGRAVEHEDGWRALYMEIEHVYGRSGRKKVMA